MTPDSEIRGIDSWRKFRRIVRASGQPLLGALPQFPGAILVTGCQRSGTTVVSRIIRSTDGISQFAFTKDDELDAALILSGRIKGLAPGRYCFQTTYMYDSYCEYTDRLSDQKIVWVLRNPLSVVFSMLNNWADSALNELFMGCGVRHLPEPYRYRLQLFGIRGVPRLHRACFAYRGKLDELSLLMGALPGNALTVIDYDELVAEPHSILGQVYQRLGLTYLERYGQQLNPASRDKAKQLAAGARRLIEETCLPGYRRAREALTVGGRFGG